MFLHKTPYDFVLCGATSMQSRYSLPYPEKKYWALVSVQWADVPEVC